MFIYSYFLILQQRRTLHLISLQFFLFIIISKYSYFSISQQQKHIYSLHYTSIYLFCIIAISLFYFIPQQPRTNTLFFHWSKINFFIMSLNQKWIFNHSIDPKLISPVFNVQIQRCHCFQNCSLWQGMSERSSPAMSMRRTSFLKNRPWKQYQNL